MSTISVIIRRKRKYYALRDSMGRLEELRPVKGSKLSLKAVKSIYKNNKTLYEDRTAQYLKKMKEVTYIKDSSHQNKDKRTIPFKKKSSMQYMVTGFYKRKEIFARSQLLGSSGLSDSRQKCKQQAWENFYYKLSQVISGGYDMDEGLRNMDKVTNIKEGWVYYVTASE